MSWSHSQSARAVLIIQSGDFCSGLKAEVALAGGRAIEFKSRIQIIMDESGDILDDSEMGKMRRMKALFSQPPCAEHNVKGQKRRKTDCDCTMATITTSTMSRFMHKRCGCTKSGLKEMGTSLRELGQMTISELSNPLFALLEETYGYAPVKTKGKPRMTSLVTRRNLVNVLTAIPTDVQKLAWLERCAGNGIPLNKIACEWGYLAEWARALGAFGGAEVAGGQADEPGECVGE